MYSTPRVKPQQVLIACDDVLGIAFQRTGEVLVIGGIIHNVSNVSIAWREDGGGQKPFQESVHLGLIPAMTSLKAWVKQDTADFCEDGQGNEKVEFASTPGSQDLRRMAD
jgi:hypothetical protein